MLGERLRHWVNIETALDECPVLTNHLYIWPTLLEI